MFDAAALTIALFLATINYKIVDYFVTPLFDQFGWPKKFMMYVSGVTGLLIALAANVNLFTGMFQSPIIGVILTGLLTGAGANIIHDVTDKPAEPGYKL